jgi:hypothetical protein
VDAVPPEDVFGAAYETAGDVRQLSRPMPPNGTYGALGEAPRSPKCHIWAQSSAGPPL